jgi:DNA-binding NarL/FixJ family response regulator
MIRLVVVDDHPIVRQGLSAALEDEPDFQVCGLSASAEDATPLVARERPDVVLLDLELPGMTGIAAIPDLIKASPATKILVFTAYDSDERILGAMRAGANGYLLKGAPVAEIVRAIRVVVEGGSALEPRVAARLVKAVREPRATDMLTPREREVLDLIALGLPGKQIARSLNISERTVKFHTASIIHRLGAENRAQAVAVAAQRGLLKPPNRG